MKKQILLNSQPITISTKFFPCLIHGQDKAGASLFTISLLAELYSQGNNILALTGYPMAMEEFVSQTGDQENTIRLTSEQDVESARQKRAIFITQENTEVFTKILGAIEEERVILLKNVELFSDEIVGAVIRRQQIIISGDIQKSLSLQSILSKEYASKVLFSPLPGEQLPELDKYQGYILAPNQHGIVTLAAD